MFQDNLHSPSSGGNISDNASDSSSSISRNRSLPEEYIYHEKLDISELVNSHSLDYSFDSFKSHRQSRHKNEFDSHFVSPKIFIENHVLNNDCYSSEPQDIDVLCRLAFSTYDDRNLGLHNADKQESIDCVPKNTSIQNDSLMSADNRSEELFSRNDIGSLDLLACSPIELPESTFRFPELLKKNIPLHSNLKPSSACYTNNECQSLDLESSDIFNSFPDREANVKNLENKRKHKTKIPVLVGSRFRSKSVENCSIPLCSKPPIYPVKSLCSLSAISSNDDLTIGNINGACDSQDSLNDQTCSLTRQSMYTSKGKVKRKCVSSLALNKSYDDKDLSRSRSLDKLSSSCPHSFRKTNYSNVQSKVKQYIKEMKLKDAKSKSVPGTPVKDKSVNISNYIWEERLMADSSISSKDINEDGLNFESKLQQLKIVPNALDRVIKLLLDERKVLQEKEKTITVLQKNFFDLQIEHAKAQHLIDMQRLDNNASKEEFGIIHKGFMTSTCQSKIDFQNFAYINSNASMISDNSKKKEFKNCEDNEQKLDTFREQVKEFLFLKSASELHTKEDEEMLKYLLSEYSILLEELPFHEAGPLSFKIIEINRLLSEANIRFPGGVFSENRQLSVAELSLSKKPFDIVSTYDIATPKSTLSINTVGPIEKVKLWQAQLNNDSLEQINSPVITRGSNEEIVNDGAALVKVSEEFMKKSENIMNEKSSVATESPHRHVHDHDSGCPGSELSININYSKEKSKSKFADFFHSSDSEPVDSCKWTKKEDAHKAYHSSSSCNFVDKTVCLLDKTSQLCDCSFNSNEASQKFANSIKHKTKACQDSPVTCKLTYGTDKNTFDICKFKKCKSLEDVENYRISTPLRRSNSFDFSQTVEKQRVASVPIAKICSNTNVRTNPLSSNKLPEFISSSTLEKCIKLQRDLELLKREIEIQSKKSLQIKLRRKRKVENVVKKPIKAVNHFDIKLSEDSGTDVRDSFMARDYRHILKNWQSTSRGKFQDTFTVGRKHDEIADGYLSSDESDCKSYNNNSDSLNSSRKNFRSTSLPRSVNSQEGSLCKCASHSCALSDHNSFMNQLMNQEKGYRSSPLIFIENYKCNTATSKDVPTSTASPKSTSLKCCFKKSKSYSDLKNTLDEAAEMANHIKERSEDVLKALKGEICLRRQQLQH